MIYFIRHGESEANARHVFAGQKDNSALTEKGRAQAREEGTKILKTGLTFEAILSSPLVRAQDTARIVADTIGYGRNIIVDDRINEYDMGTLTGTPTFEISSKLLVSAQNAEDPKAFQDRVRAALDDWKKKDGNVLLVAHAGVGRIIETIRTGSDPVFFYDIPSYPNAAIVKLEWLA